VTIREKATNSSERPASSMDSTNAEGKIQATNQSTRVQGAMDKFKDTMGNIATSPIYDNIKNATVKNFDRAMGTIGAIGATVQDGGDLGKIVTGYITGRAASEGIKSLGSKFTSPFSNYADNIIERRRTENAEASFTDEYNKYKAQKGFNTKDIEQRIQTLVKVDLSSSFADSMRETDRKFAEALQKMATQYSNRGDEDVNASIRQLINKIELKDTTNQ